ncbi:hypothetical protein BGX38DRAFT_116141 [Terfezia claveryi]|nr:hypothetical protein BGX38DRAFT_116141 [Terfezia claveryi]
MLRLLCTSITSIYPLTFRSLSASRIPAITTATTTALPLHPRIFSVDSSRYAKGTAIPPSQKRSSAQSHTHKKAQQDRGGSKKKEKSELRAVLRAKREALRGKRVALRAKREALQQQVKREPGEKAGEKKEGKPGLGAAEKKRIRKELLKEKKEKKMEGKRFAKEMKEADRFLRVKRKRSGSPEKEAWAREKDERAGWGLEEARASSPVAGGRMNARSHEVGQSRGTPVSRGTPFRHTPWMREQESKVGGRNAGNMVPDNDRLFSENNPWKYPERDDDPRRGKAPLGKREREKLRLRHSRERSASMTRRDWASSLERRSSPSRKIDLKERLRAVKLPPELMQRERDGRSASPQKDRSLSNSISSRGREAGFVEGSLTQRRAIHTSASSSYSYCGQSWREEWESRDEDRERWDVYRKGREDYERGRRGYGGGYRGRDDYRGGRQGYRDDYRQVRKGQDEEEGGVSLKGYLHSPSHFPGGNRYRPPPSALAHQPYNPSRQQEPIPETGINSYEDQQGSQGSYYQNEVEQQQRQRNTYTRTHSQIADRQQGQHTSQRQYQKEWYPEVKSSPAQTPQHQQN